MDNSKDESEQQQMPGIGVKIKLSGRKDQIESSFTNNNTNNQVIGDQTPQVDLMSNASSFKIEKSRCNLRSLISVISGVLQSKKKTDKVFEERFHFRASIMGKQQKGNFPH